MRPWLPAFDRPKAGDAARSAREFDTMAEDIVSIVDARRDEARSSCRVTTGAVVG